jgi:hypothetical protein
VRQLLHSWEKATGAAPLGVILSQINGRVEHYLDQLKKIIRATPENHPDSKELIAALQVVTSVAFSLKEEEPKNNQVMLFLNQCKLIPKAVLNRVVKFVWVGTAYWTRRKLGVKAKEKEVCKRKICSQQSVCFKFDFFQQKRSNACYFKSFCCYCAKRATDGRFCVRSRLADVLWCGTAWNSPSPLSSIRLFPSPSSAARRYLFLFVFFSFKKKKKHKRYRSRWRCLERRCLLFLPTVVSARL